jgi:hypothetical protein
LGGRQVLFEPYNNTEKAIIIPNATQNNINSFVGMQEKDNGMPAWFGGMVANYEVIPRRLQINVNTYFFTSYVYHSYQNQNFPDGRGKATIAGKPIVNMKLNFQIVPNTSLFLTVRNMLNRSSNEFYNTDSAGLAMFGGFHFGL